MKALYEDAEFLRFTEGVLHPGGRALTLEALKHILPGGSVLDVGCGLGKSVELMRERGFDAWGVEASQALLSLCECPYVREGSAYDLPGRYDALLYECVFSLLEDKGLAMRAAEKALKCGGRLIVHDVYLRQGPSLSPGVKTCAAGAVPRKALFEVLEGGGFEAVLFRDRTEAFTSFLAALIMEYGSADAFFCSVSGGCAGGAQEGVRLGYFTSVWEKKTC